MNNSGTALNRGGWPLESTFLSAFPPEREDPGNSRYVIKFIPKTCGGATTACLEVGLALYGQVIKTVIPASSRRSSSC